MAAMRISEGLRILQAKLADIEDEHDAELAANETLQDSIDAKAEARALTAVFDFLQTFKIAPTESLLACSGAICMHRTELLRIRLSGGLKVAGALKDSAANAGDEGDHRSLSGVPEERLHTSVE
jgi:hypothetical protein